LIQFQPRHRRGFLWQLTLWLCFGKLRFRIASMFKETGRGQWEADTERLLIAGLANGDGSMFGYDEEVIEVVKQRCTERYGKLRGFFYFFNLVANLPDRKPELIFGYNPEK
jgi:hypothetical protein